MSQISRFSILMCLYRVKRNGINNNAEIPINSYSSGFMYYYTESLLKPLINNGVDFLQIDMIQFLNLFLLKEIIINFDLNLFY